MKSKLLACVVFVVGMLAMTLSFADFIQGKKNILFTQNADVIRLTHCQDKKICDFHLSLIGLDNHDVVYFADRPERYADLMSGAQFVQDWARVDDNLRLHHPIGTITYFAPDGRVIQSIVMVMHPQYDAKNDVLSFDAKELMYPTLVAGEHEDPSLFLQG